MNAVITTLQLHLSCQCSPELGLYLHQQQFTGIQAKKLTSFVYSVALKFLRLVNLTHDILFCGVRTMRSSTVDHVVVGGFDP